MCIKLTIFVHVKPSTMKKKCKIIMLPTEKESNLYYSKPRDEYFETINLSDEEMFCMDWTNDHKPQHLYLISDDEIKEGDWYIDDTDTVRQSITSDKDYWRRRPDYKKIIASTDSELSPIEDYGYAKAKILFPQIPESFIKGFVKANGKIDEVVVEYQVRKQFEDEEDATYGPIHELKLTDNNEVIISMVEEKMYSREEVEEIVYNATKEVPNEDQETVLKWIKENL